MEKPDAGTGMMEEAMNRFRARDMDGAARACNDVLRRDPRHPDALYLLGMLRLMGGDPATAASLLGRATERNDRDPALWENLGLANLMKGDAVQAESALRRALALGASHGLLYMRLGLALGPQGKIEEAVGAMRTAAERSPADPDVHLNLGNALAASGRAGEALASYEKVLAIQPDHATARFNLGNIYRSMGRLDDAVAAFQQVLAIAPDDADTHNNLGIVYGRQQRLDDAVACFRRALAIDPALVLAQNNLGNALSALGRMDEAVACFQAAMARDTAHPDAYINLGIVRAKEGMHEEAQSLYARALQRDPGSFEAHFNLGRLRFGLGDLGGAARHYREAATLAPERAFVHIDLGNVFRMAGDVDAAAACYGKAIDLEPGNPDARFYQGEARKLQGRLDEAMAHYRETLERDPDHVSALGALVHLRQHVCSWDGIEAQWQRVKGAIASGAGARLSPFSVLSMPTTAAEQLASARAWARDELAPAIAGRRALGFDFAAPRERSRPRIGYLSWGFHQHATAYLTAELFERHDRSRFEIFAYAYGPDDGSEVRARIRNACEHFSDVSQESYLDTARRIYGDGVDILVDLTGYTLGARPQILALHPAPIQVSWLGYPGTLGTEAVEHLFADPFVIPPGLEAGYAEHVVRLPHCYQITDCRREIADRAPDRETHGLPREGRVFCCFNQAYKILPETFQLWMRILRSVPGSVLWLAEANPWMAANLRGAANAAGVPGDRLVFAPRRPLPEYLAQYRCADIALDTFPYTSHTTASDALWMGCPLVARAGETFASRVSGSVLANAGVPELVAETPGEYERIVIELATSTDALEGVRRKLQAARGSAPLFDTPLFVRNLEAAYTALLGTLAGRSS